MVGHLGQLSHYNDNDDVNNRVTLHTYSHQGQWQFVSLLALVFVFLNFEIVPEDLNP